MSLINADIAMRIMEAVTITDSHLKQGITTCIPRYNLLIQDKLELFSVKVSIQNLR